MNNFSCISRPYGTFGGRKAPLSTDMMSLKGQAPLSTDMMSLKGQATKLLSLVTEYTKEMKFIEKTALLFVFLVVTVTVVGQAADDGRKLTIEAGAELVSSYVWRGMYQAGASIQPSLNLSTNGVTCGVWASTDFSTFLKETDFYLLYEKRGFTIGVIDYWYSIEGMPFFKNGDSHLLEANLGYTFSEKFPLTLEANTVFWGEDDRNAAGKQRYSTYFSASFPFNVKDIDCKAGIGVSPFKGMYCEKMNIPAITLKASKKLLPSSDYSFPVFVELIFSTAQDNVFLVFGMVF